MSNSPYTTETDRFQDAGRIVEQCGREAFACDAFPEAALLGIDAEAEPSSHKETKVYLSLSCEIHVATLPPEKMAQEIWNQVKLLALRAEREAAWFS